VWTASGSPRAHWPRQFLSDDILSGAIKLSDLIGVLVTAGAAYCAYPVMYLHEGYANLDRYGLVAVAAAVTLVVLLGATDAYNWRRLYDMRWQAGRLLAGWAAVCALGLMIGFATKTSDNYSRGWVLGWMLTAPIALILGRAILFRWIAEWRRQGHFARNIAIVGAGEHAARVIAKLEQLVDANVRVVGVFDDRRTRFAGKVLPDGTLSGKPAGTVDDLIRLAREDRLDEIIVAFPLSAEARLSALTERLKHLPIDVRVSLEPLTEHLSIRGTSWIGVMPLVNVVDRPLKSWSAIVKLVEDKILASLLLAVFALPMALIALAIKLDSRGPIFFVQERFGFNNAVIRVLKFRTMFVDRGDLSGAAQTVRGDPRVTRLGRWLRLLSLDELPQLINVLRGDMSLIGPRAHALKMRAAGVLYYEAVEEYFMRHRVKPGLTGWAQVHGLRGETDTLDKAKRRLEYDLWYIDNWSLWLDITIVLSTIRTVLTRQNAY